MSAPRASARQRELGQNFLVDRNILDVIERLAELHADVEGHHAGDKRAPHHGDERVDDDHDKGHPEIRVDLADISEGCLLKKSAIVSTSKERMMFPS